MCKFSPSTANLSQPPREFRVPEFKKLKEEISSPRVLALYNPERETKVSADASAYGIAAVLFQLDGHNWRPVAFASQILSETETRYAQIEKEALALLGPVKFSEYVLGEVIT